jgi:hypothetical protein
MKEDRKGNITLSDEEARAGETSGHVRVILIVGIILAVMGLGITYIVWFS